MARGRRKKRTKKGGGGKKKERNGKKRGRIGCVLSWQLRYSVYSDYGRSIGRRRFFISSKEKKRGREGRKIRLRAQDASIFCPFFFFPLSLPSFFFFLVSLSVRRSAFSPVEKCITGRVKRPPKNRRNVRGIVEPRSSTCTRQLGPSPSSLFPKKERNLWNPPVGGFEGVVSSRGNGGKEKIRPVISGRRGKTCCKIGIRSSRYPGRFILLIKRNTVIVDTSIRQLVEHRYPIPRGISRSETNSNITSFIYIYYTFYIHVCMYRPAVFTRENEGKGGKKANRSR